MNLTLPAGDARRGLLFTGNDRIGRFRAGFHAWLADNYYVYDRFCEEADKVRATGRAHYSARTIAEVLRHESTVREKAGDYKLNNNFVPDMARLYGDMRGEIEFFRERGR